MPDLSHLLAILPAPCWFWTRTLCPRLSGGRFLVCSLQRSKPLKNLVFMASSLFCLQSTQTSEGEKFPGLIGKKSLIGRPKISWAGESPYSESGVFLCCIRARAILSWSGEPSDLVLSSRILLADLTAVSARRLE